MSISVIIIRLYQNFTKVLYLYFDVPDLHTKQSRFLQDPHLMYPPLGNTKDARNHPFLVEEEHHVQ